MNLSDLFDVPVPAIVLAEGEFGNTGGIRLYSALNVEVGA